MNSDPYIPDEIIPPPGGDPGGTEGAADLGLDQMMSEASTQIVALKAECDEFREKWLRAEAEMANVRARAKRDVEEARQYAVQKFARDVAEAADNLKRGVESVPPPNDHESPVVGKLREGFAGVERSFVGLLERNGIARIDPTGAPFDPNLHQAMSEQETAEHPPGTVVQAWTPAWTLHGRLLRPAMVVVAKAPAHGPGAAGGAGAGSHLDTTA